MEAFAAVFEELDDPRTGNAKRHLLSEILVIALCTVASGGETCADMALFGQVKQAFLEQFLTLPYGIPSHDTFSRVFRLLDPAQFRTCSVAFMRRFAETCEGVVAIDGKTLRRSFDAASGASPLHLVSAWACEQRLVLGQLAIDSKSNEITAVPKLLELLTLKGTIVTADALNCQRATAGQIIGQGSDYVLALKGNQGRLFDDVRTFLDDPAAPLTTGHEPDAGHGRLEQRRAVLTGDIAWLQERHAWPGLQAIGKVTARREVGGRTTIKTRYYLLSTVLSPERFSQVVRSHWDIEVVFTQMTKAHRLAAGAERDDVADLDLAVADSLFECGSACGSHLTAASPKGTHDRREWEQRTGCGRRRTGRGTSRA
jgi:predicted transposase YbfD/YdcC